MNAYYELQWIYIIFFEYKLLNAYIFALAIVRL